VAPINLALLQIIVDKPYFSFPISVMIFDELLPFYAPSSSFNSLKATIEQVQVQAVARDNRNHKARNLALTVALD